MAGGGRDGRGGTGWCKAGIRGARSSGVAGSGRPDAWDWDPFSCCWDQGLNGFEENECMEGYMKASRKNVRARRDVVKK
jgi:hypothetical protein